MANARMTYTVDMLANASSLINSLNQIQTDINNKPLSVAVKADMGTRLADVTNFAKEVGATTSNLESMKVTYQEFFEIASGRTIAIPVKEVVALNDGFGNTLETVRELDAEYAKMAKADKSAYTFLKTTTAEANFAKAIGVINKEFASLDKEVKNTSKSANLFLIKAENMSGPAVDKTRDLANEVLRLGEAYNDIRKNNPQDVKGAVDLADAHRKAGEAFTEQSKRTERSAAGLQAWGSTMQRAIKQSFAYAIAMRAVREVQQEVGKAIKYVVDLNTEMTKIQVLQVEGAKTTSQINALADSFNRLAQKMGASTLEVARGSVEWLRQGKTISETQDLLKSTLMLSKLGNMEAADATEKLTSTLNGYGMAASEAASIVDKLVAVDNVAATSTKELAVAMQYSAAVAKQTGVSMEQLISYIGTVSETTRQNAESIGQGMKTMLTRMQDIKGGKLDEDSLGINNVEIALRKANVKLRDSKNSFRDFGDVLEELAGKWDSLSETERAFTAKSIAGIRQVNMFTVLMNNMGRALELQEVQFNSAGLAANRYQIYLQSIEAKLAQVKASFEGLVQDFVSGGTVASLVDMARKILEIVDGFGGLKNVLGGVVASFALINLPGIIALVAKAVSAIKGLTIAGTGLKAILLAIGGSASALVLPIAAAIVAFTALAIAVERAIVTQKEHAKLAQEATAKADTLSGEIANAEALTTEYKKLKSAIDERTLSGEELIDAENRLYDIQKQLKDIFPSLNGFYDAQGRFILTDADNTQTLIDKKKILLALAEKEAKKHTYGVLFESKGEGGTYSSEEGADVRRKNSIIGKLVFTDEDRQAAKEVFDSPVISKALTKSLENGYKKFQKDLDMTKFEEISGPIMEALANLYKVDPENAKKFAQAYVDSIDESLPDLKKSMQEHIDSLAEYQVKVNTNTAKEHAKNLTKYGFQELYRSKAENETQVQNRMKFGSDQEYNDYLITDKLPSMTKGIEQLKDAFELLSSSDIINSTEIEKLHALGVQVETSADGVQKLYYEFGEGEAAVKKYISSSDDYATVLMDILRNTEMLTPEIEAFIENYLRLSAAEQDAAINAEKFATSTDLIVNKANTVADALKEQAQNGKLSEDTMYNLASAGISLANGQDVLTQSTYNAIQAELRKQYADSIGAGANANLKATIDMVNAGLWENAAANLASAEKAGTNVVMQRNLINAMRGLQVAAFGPVEVSGGGGGSAPPNPRIKEIEGEVKQLEKKKKALDDELDNYKKYIDARKEALKLAKEEQDYNDEALKKSKSLARMKTEIALLALDDSEEARAQRLALEEEAAGLEEEIAADAEDRKLDVQTQALDDLQEAFEATMQAQQDAIDLLIEKLKEESDALKDTGSSGGGAGGLITKAFESIGSAIDTAKAKLNAYDADFSKLKDGHILAISEQINKWEEEGLKVDDIKRRVENLTQALANSISFVTELDGDIRLLPPLPQSMFYGPQFPGVQNNHQGGLIESHHDGNFAGNLKSNEVFSKLLKGEYVATENQMDQFMKNVLPRIANYPEAVRTSGTNNSTGDMTFNMPITVNGSLDKNAIPDLKNAVVKEINTALERRGIRRSATNFSI